MIFIPLPRWLMRLFIPRLVREAQANGGLYRAAAGLIEIVAP